MTEAQLPRRDSTEAIHKCGTSKLPPDACRYLERRGITQECWERAGVRYFEPRDTRIWFGQIARGVLFPYADIDGEFADEFGRIRILGARSDRKFIQRAATGNRFYFAPLGKGRSWQDIARDAKQPIHIAEGEVKTPEGMPSLRPQRCWLEHPHRHSE